MLSPLPSTVRLPSIPRSIFVAVGKKMTVFLSLQFTPSKTNALKFKPPMTSFLFVVVLIYIKVLVSSKVLHCGKGTVWPRHSKISSQLCSMNTELFPRVRVSRRYSSLCKSRWSKLSIIAWAFALLTSFSTFGSNSCALRWSGKNGCTTGVCAGITRVWCDPNSVARASDIRCRSCSAFACSLLHLAASLSCLRVSSSSSSIALLLSISNLLSASSLCLCSSSSALILSSSSRLNRSCSI
mmetsp:Transcript_4785/g.10062  ORF Transcript_4785/g.10062 Transcript_4785/m.10062 type:complete len:240 (-) Transcript_4785:643-1362(-)